MVLSLDAFNVDVFKRRCPCSCVVSLSNRRDVIRGKDLAGQRSKLENEAVCGIAMPKMNVALIIRQGMGAAFIPSTAALS